MSKLDFKPLVICIIVGVVLIAGSVVFKTVYLNPVQADFDAGFKTVSEKKNEISTAQKRLDNLRGEDLDSVTGVERARVKSDKDDLSKALKPIMTWSSEDGYVRAKEKSVKLFGEKPTEIIFKLSGNFTDLNISREMGEISLYPVKLSGKIYVYYCILPFKDTYVDKDGNKISADRSFVLTFSKGEKMELENVIVYSGTNDVEVVETAPSNETTDVDSDEPPVKGDDTSGKTNDSVDED